MTSCLCILDTDILYSSFECYKSTYLTSGMAYALLAWLPPVFGLYTSLYPTLICFFFGTSRHISIEVDVAARNSYRVQVAAATTLLCGLIQVLLGVVKFGLVGTYLSEPLVRACTTAAALHDVVAQLKSIFGVSPARFNGLLSLVYTLKDICLLLPQTHLPTLVASLVSLVLQIAAKELNPFLSPRLPVPIPVELITIMAATLISNCGHLNRNYSIQVVGEIPSGRQHLGRCK
ncbi:solute carrier family 26 member 6, like 1 isoform X3 [Festucalex cinctus]